MSDTTSITSTNTDGQSAPADEGGQGPADTGQQAPTTPAAPPAPPSGTGQDEAPSATIARLEQQLAAARRDAGKSRVTAKQTAADEARAELAQQIGRALGLVQDDAPPDPAALTQQLATEQQHARQTAVELAVFRTARDAGGDPDALLDSRAFAAALADVDPTDTAAVRAAVEAAVAANPKLAAQRAPGPSRAGAEFSGPPSEGVTAQQFAAMDYARRAELYQSDPDTYRRLSAGS
ncbi:hypothetical protein [Streptomyces catenulae]|uniref:Scaffolding protein n=1 Tax=Streptomyces catenulae TaxID=66875 RepID=A0ABV2Z4J1_9ACTN|nr:hypothetical protein [Streptomyces catenulae]